VEYQFGSSKEAQATWECLRCDRAPCFVPFRLRAPAAGLDTRGHLLASTNEDTLAFELSTDW